MTTAVKLLSLVGILILLHGSTDGAVIRCFNRMKEKIGSFKSPLHPSRYPANEFCEYIIRAEPDYYIEVTFTKFKLEPLFNGEKTDYIQILDGGKNNREREITYDGSQTEGFSFTSLTSRVFIHFHSDAQFGYSGFYATYKMNKRRCAVPEVENGQVKCDLNDNGQARTCELACDDTYLPDGDPKIFCQGTEFNKQPRCIPDPSVHCDMKEVQHLGPLDCREDPGTDVTACTFQCPIEYFPEEYNEINCIEGIWDRVPKCKPRPTVDCDLAEVEEIATECERDSVTKVITSCGFVCDNPLYVPVNYLVCDNGTWAEETCIPDPEIMDKCLNGSLLIRDVKVDDEEVEDEEEECPFNAEERESYLKAFLDDLKDVQLLPGQGRGAGIKRYRCDPRYCWVLQPGKTPYIDCHKHSLALQKRFNLREKKRKLREDICFKCRTKKCLKPAIFFN